MTTPVESSAPSVAPSGRIVVGVDGSELASAALAWAIDEARLRGASLDVVVSWEIPVMAVAEPVFVPIPDKADLEDGAERTADATIDMANLEASGVPFTVHTPEGRPGESLVEMAEGADLLVVGTHGKGVLKELVLGSVSNYCAHHSPCPVVLIRRPDLD